MEKNMEKCKLIKHIIMIRKKLAYQSNNIFIILVYL